MKPTKPGFYWARARLESTVAFPGPPGIGDWMIVEVHHDDYDKRLVVLLTGDEASKSMEHVAVWGPEVVRPEGL